MGKYNHIYTYTHTYIFYVLQNKTEYIKDRKTFPTFSERKNLAHVLAGFAKPIGFLFLLQQFYQIQVTVVIIGIDGQLKKHCQNSHFIYTVLQKPS